MSSIASTLRRNVISLGTLAFGSRPKLHRIPFGPIRGSKIFTSFAISPRMYFGFDESRVVEWISQCVNPGDVTYDVGAHIGYTTVVLSRRVQNKGQVHSFEILTSTASFLRETVEANRLKNVRIHIVGLSDKEGSIDLPVEEHMMTSINFAGQVGEGRRIESCRLCALDDYIKEQGLPLPSFIKMDIEGAEGACLTGGMQLIREHRPTMIIEFHGKQRLVEGFDILHPLGYTLTTYSGEAVTAGFLADRQFFHESVLCLP